MSKVTLRSSRSIPSGLSDLQRAIDASRRRVRDQIQRIRTIRAEGGDTRLACRVLQYLLDAVAQMRWNRDLLVAAYRMCPGRPRLPGKDPDGNDGRVARRSGRRGRVRAKNANTAGKHAAARDSTGA